MGSAGAEKLRLYEGGVAGQLRGARDSLRERWAEWRATPRPPLLSRFRDHRHIDGGGEGDAEDFAHLYRLKTRAELVRVSAAVAGIEFSYAAETAFVSPLLLKLRVAHGAMSLAWAVSPMVGFFVTPLLGSLSDRCRLPCGRRRPFIALLATGVLLGLVLVPNGEALGYWLGDPRPSAAPAASEAHPWGVLATVAGAVLLDFDADACQSPARAYLLDMTLPEEHARGLSTFTVVAGLGGCAGYALGALDWDATALGRALGGHVHAVFTLVTIIFAACVVTTLTSFREVPLAQLQQHVRSRAAGDTSAAGESRAGDGQAAAENQGYQRETTFSEGYPTVPAASTDAALPELPQGAGEEAVPSLRQYLLSIVHMPPSMRILCLTNLFCWMAHVCYSLYFTDYVGEAVFEGDPQAPQGSAARERYEAGVRFGCWGMAVYSLSCACYSLLIERLIRRFRARPVYVGGPLTYACGMLLMALCRHRVAVLLFSWTAGVMYSTLFTMPYLLVAHYHALQTFGETKPEPKAMAETEKEAEEGAEAQAARGLGTDVAIVSSMVFLAQLTLSCVVGTVVSVAGSTTAVVVCAAVLGLCGAVSASRVLYLDL